MDGTHFYDSYIMSNSLWLIIIDDSLSSAWDMSQKTQIYGGKPRKLKKRDFMTHKLSYKLWVIKNDVIFKSDMTSKMFGEKSNKSIHVLAL